jgi:phosphatidylglycerol lysyltransferase
VDAVLPSPFVHEDTPEKRDVAHARALVLEHGWNSTSFQIVNPGIKRWFTRSGDAVVGYVSANGIRVVVGAPVCARERLGDVVDLFEADASMSKKGVCYFAAESRLESLVSGTGDHSKFLIGAQPAWDPREWPDVVATHKSLRAQLNRARNKGVVVNEWPAAAAKNDTRLASVLERWLATKHLPPLHFMVEPDTLARLEHRRIFVAERAGEVAGFVVLSPVAMRKGWLFEQFPHVPGAPNGTVELMVDAAMRTVAADGCSYATLGLSPLSRRADVPEIDSAMWLRVILAWVRKHGQRFYNFDGLDAFKAKLAPTRWEPVYAVVNRSRVRPRDLYAIASVFSGNAPYTLMARAIYKGVRTELSWIKRRVG